MPRAAEKTEPETCGSSNFEGMRRCCFLRVTGSKAIVGILCEPVLLLNLEASMYCNAFLVGARGSAQHCASFWSIR